ncbi:hypothetical protein [Devosia psychrophila]|jgi:hypothetical protein|uniref:Uncharacterized protein n=1 Tax=Devosia psychrophila TaxID=728005 RepID=A0A0F5PUV3_9HYPH|nr:hypothetical protein [Devosia psychrophila]KKC32166.1 hypothetical protein WH91_15480 [Devosia psychrophila]SFC34933.1 hypothetical protein SAMN04488059_10474 [Devosia psychrophila]
MRVPSIGLKLDERLIIREGYRIAEHMMRNFRDPPTTIEIVSQWLASARQTMIGLYRPIDRG